MALRRLCRISVYLDELLAAGRSHVTSARLGEVVGSSAATVRKDINRLGTLGASPSGYDTRDLRSLVVDRLGLEHRPRACVIGLNWLGRALLGGADGEPHQVEVVAGFDAKVNRLELTQTEVPLFPIFELEATVRRLGIEIALVADAGSDPERTAARLAAGGVRGVLNFASQPLPAGGIDVVTDLAVADELRYLVARTHANDTEEESSE